MCRRVLVCIAGLLMCSLVGCATMMRPPTQSVMVVGGQKGMEISTSSNRMKLTGETKILTLRRSRDDIFLTIRCPKKKDSSPSINTILIQSYPNGWFIWGNLFNFSFPVGHLIDYLTEQGYDFVGSVSVGGYCPDD